MSITRGLGHAYVVSNVNYGVTNFNHSMGDVDCYILYVLHSNHWKCYLCTYVPSVGVYVL
jgi:hypothetical protein